MNDAICPNLDDARSKFKELEASDYPCPSDVIEGAVDIIYKALEKAGVDASALDPSGESTEAKMEERIYDAGGRNSEPLQSQHSWIMNRP